ncbi:hypothetical protein ACHQM5_006459 [Ranunculus cassubicifolius]
MMLGSLPILPLPAPPTDGNLGPLPASQVTETSQPNDSPPPAAPTQVATHTKPLGIIYPPPDIRSIVDKTVSFVSKNGPDFERRIMSNNAGNAKFNFLIPTDPYHAYYQHRLLESRNQAQQAPLEDSEMGGSEEAAQSGGDGNQSVAKEAALAKEKSDLAALLRQPRKPLEPPEAEQYTVRIPEGITGEELDIIKLTAQYIARNGKHFLNDLTKRELSRDDPRYRGEGNPQFNFLRPTHSMFMFFTALTDAYSKVLMPPKGLTDKLKKSVVDMTTVLERCLQRLEWDRSQEQARQKAEDEIEQERVQMAMIDWHDFVVVETIEFAEEEEDLPPPMTLEDVIRRSKITSMDDDLPDVVEPGKEADMEMDDEEVQLVREGMQAASLEEDNEEKKSERKGAAQDEQEAPMRIVKNWKRPEDRIPAERDPTKFVVSPITGELVPTNEMAEHMRISLIDPKYKEQKERMMAKFRETTLAQDDEILRNIDGLARTRPDIFGTTEEEVSNAVKAEIEKNKEEQPKQVIWDGHTGSIGRTANQAMSQNAGEDQMDAINNGGLPGPAAPPPRPGMPSIRSLPLPPGLPLNMPRMMPNPMQYVPNNGIPGVAPPRPPMMLNPSVRPPPPPMQLNPGQQLMRPPLPPMSMNIPSVPLPPPPGSQFTPIGGQRPFGSMPPLPMNMMPPPPLPQGMPPPPPEEAPPPLPEEPEPKRQKIDDSSLLPEAQFLAQHPGPVRITVSVPNVEEGNLRGQHLEITIQSLSETIASLKEKIAGEVQLPANKQKLSGRAGFLKDNMSLAYYNIGAGETLTLALRERGGRKR